ncbi:MAG: sigma-70 family RNA polymerase sigma factor [Planctomycetia bacterium]|nr:sigma-70 family RNA polymerase sigma factor [Planctomycetia bacterium]
MSEAKSHARLSQIQTLWTVVGWAHGDGSAETIRIAQEQLIERYGSVVRRYLLGALRNADAADELSQEFALRFVRGDLKRVDRERGRFRDYVKGTLFHLIGDYHRRNKRRATSLTDGLEPATEDTGLASQDEVFLEGWRAELINRAWQALERLEQESGQPFHRVLQLRATQPEMRSGEMAVALGPQLERQVSADWVRQSLHRARERFAGFLLHEVRDTLDDPTLEQLEEELITLGLHGYCQPALDACRATPGEQKK